MVYAGCLPCSKGTYVSDLDAANHWIEMHWMTCKQSALFGQADSGTTPREKYAELEAAGQERPRCNCHQEPMRWERRTDYKAGGRWRCRVGDQERLRSLHTPVL